MEGITDIRDESDRSGMRVVIELRRGVNASMVLNNLYKATQLQRAINVNMVAVVDGTPKQLGLREMLQEFIDFR